jgi:hypothetical protein
MTKQQKLAQKQLHLKQQQAATQQHRVHRQLTKRYK